MTKSIKRILAAVIALYFLCAIALFLMQRSLIYSPTDQYPHSFATQQVLNDGQSINLLVLNPGKRHAVIYFGGNGEAVSQNVNAFEGLLIDHTMYFVEYRGYGASTGEPIEAALYSDALKIYDTLSLGNFESVSVIGRSLGSGVATYLASKRQLDAMVLITPYDSILNVAQQRYPIFPLSMLLKDKYESSDRAPELSLPTLVLIAPNDTVVPGAHTLNLIKSFRSDNVSQITVPNTGHNSILNDPLYYSSIKEFILAQ